MDAKQISELVAKRYPTRETARLQVFGRTEVMVVRMSNLSATGAFFEMISAAVTPRVGQLVSVTVALREMNKTHVLSAEIVWVKGNGIGVIFVKQRDLLQRLSQQPKV